MTPLAYLESATKIDHGGHSSLTLRGHALNAGLDPGGGGGGVRQNSAKFLPISIFGGWQHCPPCPEFVCVAAEASSLLTPLYCAGGEVEKTRWTRHDVLGRCVMILDDHMGEMDRTCFDKHETRDYSYTCASAALESEDTIPLM